MLILASLLLFAAQADAAYPVRCSLFEVSGPSHDGACQIRYSTNAEGRSVETIQAGETRLIIEQLDRQGQWARVLINGRPGVRYEINRETYAYSTDDLRLNLDWTSAD